MKQIHILLLFLFLWATCIAQVSYIPYRVGNLFGVSDVEKKLVVKPQFNDIYFVGLMYQDSNGILGIKKKGDKKLTTLIVNGKILIEDEDNIYYEGINGFIKGKSLDGSEYPKYKLYANSGKRINSYKYLYVYVLKQSYKEVLLFLKNEQNVNKIALYDIEKETFTKIYADNINNIGNLPLMYSASDEVWKFENNHIPLEMEVHRINEKIEVTLKQLPPDINLEKKDDKWLLIRAENRPFYQYEKPEKILSLEKANILYNIRDVKKCYRKYSYSNKIICEDKFQRQAEDTKVILVEDSNHKKGLYDGEIELLPIVYDEIYITPRSNIVIVKWNNKWFIKDLKDNPYELDNEIVTYDNLLYISGLKVKNGMNIYEMFHSETFEFLYYALEDGTLFYTPYLD